MAGQGENDDSNVVIVLLIIVLGGVSFVVWWLFSAEIMSGIRWLRYGQLEVLAFFLGTDYVVTDKTFGESFTLGELLSFMPILDKSDLFIQQISLFTDVTMSLWRWPLAGLLFLFAGWSYLRGPGTKYRRKMGLDGVLEEHAKAFPIIKPFVNFNPLKQSVRVPGDPVPNKLPIFAEALSPEEWLAFHMVSVNDEQKIDQQTAYGAFVQQLGRRWQGISYLKPHEKALLAAFALKSVRRREEADDLLSEIALCWDAKKGWKPTSSLSDKISKILKNAKITKPAYMKANQHSYVKTALMRALQYARTEGGVLASAQFVWLRGFDRSLWYALNNLGRRSFHSETMGVMAHFQAEKSMERAIPVPQVVPALDSLQAYVDSHQPLKIPQLVRSKG